ncbi:DUF58 domain-containing protein [Pseudolysinimonas sp.]|uniref:DUF58 domain-containing protein n=1 Tax=Pseudolysinimonas sp. TaxID=2680009 RepID=UPI00286BE93A|nr:DUF58 domain-containing protein [Pseudolysinimonas sp.]
MARRNPTAAGAGVAGEGTRALRRTRSLRITWRAGTSIALGVLAVFLGYGLGRREYFVAACLAMLLPLIGLAFVRLRRPKLEISRLFSPPVVAVGGVVQVTVRVTNLGASPTTPLAWDDALPWFEPIETREIGPIGLGRRRPYITSYDLHPPRRGLYAIGPFVAEHEDPFGMATATIAVGKPERLVVVPAVSSLTDGGPNLIDGEGEAHLVQRKVAGNDDDLTTREYRRGDALRRVHWRASARHDQLMVRQEEHRSHPDARILVDTRRRGYPDAFSDTGMSWSAEWASDAFEWVVRMVGSLGLHLELAGFRVAVEETARAQIEPIGDRWEGRRAEGFLTSLAGVQLLDRTVAELAALPPSEGSGPVFAILGDPEDATVDWLIRRRSKGEAGYAFLVHARPVVLERLRDAGWVCVVSQSIDDPADAWRGAANQTGYARGSR